MAISGLLSADGSARCQDGGARLRFGIGRQCHMTATAICEDCTPQHKPSMRSEMRKERFQSAKRADRSRRAECLDGHPIQIAFLQSWLDTFVSP